MAIPVSNFVIINFEAEYEQTVMWDSVYYDLWKIVQ